jgi:FkbH-like protein
VGDSLRDKVRDACAGDDLAMAQAAVRDLIQNEPTTATAIFTYRQTSQMAERLGLPLRRLAILASFTIDPVVPHLGIQRFLAGERIELGFWPYQQWYIALAQAGDLDEFDPDAVLVLHHLEDVAPFLAHRHLAERGRLEEERTAFISGIDSAIRGFRARSAKPVILNTLIPARSGIERYFDRKVSPSRSAEVEKYNSDIAAIATRQINVFVFDYAALVSDHGRLNWFDTVKNHLNKTAVASPAIPVLSAEISAFLSTLFGVRRKVVAVDLDNTLWGGIVGEDGAHGLAVNGDYPGNSYEAFQSFLSNLRASGLLLAAISKNNLEDAHEAFTENPLMPLRWKDFSAHKINWNDKVANLKAAAAEIDVGIDSFVFADDNPIETGLVSEYLPEVNVVSLAGPPSLFVEKLLAAGGLDAVTLTIEDFARAKTYVAESDRREYRDETTDISDFLSGLGLRLELHSPTQDQIERVAQLFGKTNQFNLTTKRYGADEIAEMLADQDTELVISELSDRFGNYGLIGVAVLRHLNGETEIDSLLLSCRALGRNVEDGLLAFFEQQARSRGASWLIGLYSPTAKNSQVADLYSRFGFVESDQDGRFVRDLETSPPLPFPSNMKINESNDD